MKIEELTKNLAAKEGEAKTATENLLKVRQTEAAKASQMAKQQAETTETIKKFEGQKNQAIAEKNKSQGQVSDAVRAK